MTTTQASRPAADGAPAVSRPMPLWRRVGVPSEHGGWSLTAEPVILGLVVSWSWAGLALGVAALLAFMARTPLKFVLVDRWRDRRRDRSRLAARIASVEILLIIALGLVAAAISQSAWFWVPPAVALPLVAIELWFDMRSRGRRLVPELAGTVGIGSVVAAIALAAGESTALAIGLWVVVAARAGAAIPYARAQVFRAHHRAVTRWHADLAQVLATAAVATAWGLGAIPLAPVVAVAAIAVFNIAALRGPVQRAVVVGLQQMFFGFAVIAVTAIAISA